jgi:hypothetical protein
MTHPNAAPESLELQLLREIRDEMRERLHAVEEELRLVVHEQQRLGTILGTLVAVQRPSLRAVSDSWVPDHGDGGREP